MTAKESSETHPLLLEFFSSYLCSPLIDRIFDFSPFHEGVVFFFKTFLSLSSQSCLEKSCCHVEHKALEAAPDRWHWNPTMKVQCRLKADIFTLFSLVRFNFLCISSRFTWFRRSFILSWTKWKDRGSDQEEAWTKTKTADTKRWTWKTKKLKPERLELPQSCCLVPQVDVSQARFLSFAARLTSARHFSKAFWHKRSVVQMKKEHKTPIVPLVQSKRFCNWWQFCQKLD